MTAYEIVVVGGGPAGSAAAIYAARKGIRVGIVAERFGGQLMDTLGIENFVSVKETEGPKLTAALEEHVKTYDVDVMAMQRVGEEERDSRPDTVAAGVQHRYSDCGCRYMPEIKCGQKKGRGANHGLEGSS